jgi:electron transfer flavoprotein beta subunit
MQPESRILQNPELGRILPMKRILVAVKRVVDYNIRIRVKPDNTGVMTEGVKQSLNPFDEIALEEALRQKEKGLADEVVVVSIGPADVQNQLRTALAMGADRAILVNSAAPIEPLDAAKIFLKLAEREQPLLFLLGKQAVDDDNNQTGQMLAALWNRPQATFASKLEITGAVARVTREVDAGLETLEVDLPAVVTADLRLNEPRYVKLPEIIKAKKKPLEAIEPATLGVTPAVRVKAVHYAAPAARSRGVMVKNAAELVAALNTKGLLS